MSFDQPKRPWSGFAYLVLILLAGLTAYYLAYPLGEMVSCVFQRLTDAFANHR